MITVLLVICILIYFFLRSQKMKKEHISSWKQIGIEEEREQLRGTITYLFTQKKRYFNQYWFVELEASVYSPKEKETLKVIWRRPYTEDIDVPKLHKNEPVLLKGNRRHKVFYANTIDEVL